LTLPKPDEVTRRLDQIRRLLPNIDEQYGTAYDVGLGKVGVGLQPGRRSIGDSDPTGDIVTSEWKERCRAAARRAEHKVEQAFGALDTAATALESVIGRRYSQPGRSRNAVVSEEEFKASLEKKRARVEGELDAG
jgi:hypothetical protein